MNITKNGRYRGRAVGQVVLGKSRNKGTPQIEFYCEVTQGEFKGASARYTGYFGPNSADRVVESLQTCGWEGEDLGEFADGGLHGLDKNEVELVIELEEYETNTAGEDEPPNIEKRVTPRVQFINGGPKLSVENAMSKEEAEAFGARMRGLVLKGRTKKTPAQQRKESDSFEFGANAPSPQNAASGTKPRF
jgi:hypothetical protein